MKKKIVKKATPKKVVVKKSRVEKPYNNGTMSAAAFFGWLKNALRRLSISWKPIAAVKKAARRPYKGPNKRQKFEYCCNICNQYVSDKNCAVDHIIPVGILRDFSDLPSVVKNLFIEVDGLQLICNTCHDLKSKEDVKLMRENYKK